MALDQSEGAARTAPVDVTAPAEPLGFWASYRAARRNVLELIPEAAYREPALAGGRGRGWIMLMDPPALERVLKTRVDAYPKSPALIRLMSPREGDNLITLEGPDWLWTRRALAPVFAPAALDGTDQAIARAADHASAALVGAAGQTVDVFAHMVGASCDVICEIALSSRDAVDREALADSVNRYVATIGRISLLDLLRAPRWIPRPGALLNRSRAQMDALADQIIAARKARGPADPPDLLDRLIAARDPETGRTMSAVDQRNNLLGFLFAGHETTALALTWALYLLALDRAAQDKAAALAGDVLGDRAATGADLPRLDYFRQVIEEALRLYPPAGFLTRLAREPDRLAGHDVAAGATVILPIYALHRHRLHWEEPQTFAPERFAPEAAARRARFSYLPFGAGPRVCVGAALALREAQLILATVIARASVALPARFQPDPRMWFTLRPGTGMPLVVNRR